MDLSTAPEVPARRRTRDSQETRERILTAASRLFSAADSRGASLRAIAREAGVNPALVHYHFGTRERLLEVTVLRALEPIQLRRQGMIRRLRDRVRKESAPPTIRDLARLFVEPLAACPTAPTEREAIELRMLTRIFSEERRLAEALTLAHFGDVMREFAATVEAALPALPVETRGRRIQFCIQTALETLSGPQAAATRANTPGDDAPRALVADLIDFLAGGLAAPTSAIPPSTDPAPTSRSRRSLP